ncbi:MAG: PAS domain S-box protein [Bacteroidales bacterium]|nr:MAG: PAS domain S-box protein [Bacteroidales bacterium]
MVKKGQPEVLTSVGREKRINYLEIVAKFANELYKLTRVEEIFTLIGKHLSGLIKDSVIMSVWVDIEKGTVYPKKITGLGSFSEKVVEILGDHPENLIFTTRGLDEEGLKSGKLLKVTGGLYELSMRQTPEKVCRALEKLINVSEIFQIGYTWEEKLYGGAVLILRNNKMLEHKELIEMYFNQASIALQRILAHEALRESKNLYQDWFDLAPDMYFSINPDGTIKSVNRFGANYLGYKKEELIGQPVWNVVYEEDIGKVRDHILEILSEKTQQSELEFRKITKEGTILVVQERVKLILDDQGTPLEVRIICRDITEHRRFEKELIDRESQIRTILKYSPVPQIIEDFQEARIFLEKLMEEGITDIHQYFEDYTEQLLFCRQKVKIIEVNNAFLELFKTGSLEELVENVDQIITYQSTRIFVEGLLRLMEGEDSFRSETIYFDLDRKKVEAITRWAVVPGHEDTLDMIVVSMEDMTERNLANKQLEILSSAIDQSPISVIIYDSEGKIEYANPKFTEISGYTFNEVVGRKAVELPSAMVPDLGFEDLISSVQEAKEWVGEFQNRKKDGELYWELASISAITNQSGEINHIVAIKEDITKRKETEQELIEAKTRAEESDRLKTSFLANMSHEIRTPMNAIVGFAELLKDPDLAQEQRTEFSSILTSSCETLSALIDDIVDIARIEAGQTKIKFSECSVDEILHELYTFFTEEIKRKGKDIELKLKSTLGNITVITDKARLRQVLSNLLGNALKFTDSGQIEFGCVLKYDNTIEFVVTDTGIGIPEEMQELVFDRFRQLDSSTSRKHGGTGLGLTISKNLVDLLGGSIWLESVPGKGSSFFFTIPVEPKEREETKKSLHLKIIKDVQKWPSKKILIVEDNLANFEFFKAVLSKTGAGLIRASNGMEAIDLIESGNPIDLVLMDIQMPEMNGYEATRQIKKRWKNIPVIAQTAYAMPHDKEKSLSAGCDDYLSKPIRPDDLIAMVGKYL